MIFLRRAVLLLLSVMLLATAVSCVESRNPLSDEKTSILDERLIGDWRPEGENDVGHWRRSKSTKNAIESTDGENVAAKETLLIFTTAIKSKTYLSCRYIEEPIDDSRRAPPKICYTICQYEFPENDTLKVRFMDPDVIVKAIGDRKVRGEIKHQPGPGLLLMLLQKVLGVDDRIPIITDSPEGIAKYLESHADDCYPPRTTVMMLFKQRSGSEPGQGHKRTGR
jgi:hypothetical protein